MNNDASQEIINGFSQYHKTIVFVEKIPEQNLEKVKVSKQKLEEVPKQILTLKIICFKIGKPVHYFQEKIQKTITEAIENCKMVRLSDCTEIAKSCKISIDEEDDKDCQKAYEHAKKILA